MNFVNFPEANKIYRSKIENDIDGPAYQELRVCATKDSEGYILEIGCCEFSADEMVQAIVSGRLYFGVHSSPIPPVFLSVFNPLETIDQKEERMKSNRKISGAIDILIERAEQLDKHGFTIEHDAKHMHGELKLAAMYCVFLDIDLWPHNWSSYLAGKISAKPEEERLAIAGALLAAHIDWINNQKEIHESEN